MSNDITEYAPIPSINKVFQMQRDHESQDQDFISFDDNKEEQTRRIDDSDEESDSDSDSDFDDFCIDQYASAFAQNIDRLDIEDDNYQLDSLSSLGDDDESDASEVDHLERNRLNKLLIKQLTEFLSEESKDTLMVTGQLDKDVQILLKDTADMFDALQARNASQRTLKLQKADGYEYDPEMNQFALQSFTQHLSRLNKDIVKQEKLRLKFEESYVEGYSRKAQRRAHKQTSNGVRVQGQSKPKAQKVFKQKKEKKVKAPKAQRKFVTRNETASAGLVVGNHAPALSSNNMGHRLLSKLGWKAGDSLGGTDSNGIKDPVTAVMRARGRGIGAE